MEKIETGVSGLDQILYGGFPKNSTILISGAPGTGKTILTQNILFNINKQKDSKILYLTTVSEPQIKILKNQQQFSYFDSNAFMDSVIFHDIGSKIISEGIGEMPEIIDKLIEQHRPVLIAIDSIKAIIDLLSEQETRKLIYELNIKFTFWEINTLLIGEYIDGDEVQRRPEASIADGIIHLYGTEERKHQKRYLRILKMRGTDFLTGEHCMKITGDGILLYPRLNPVVKKQTYDINSTNQPTGISGLDEMLHGGIPSGTTTIISGSTGTGKTLLGLSWICRGAEANETGLIITLEESPELLIKAAESFGWDLLKYMKHGLIKILHISSIEMDLDELVYNIQMMVEENKIKRVLINSISSIEVGVADKIKYTDWLWAAADFFKSQGISLMLVNESPNLFNVSQITKHTVSYIADNIIMLFMKRSNSQICKFISVLKMRGQPHSNSVRKLAITDKGPVVDNNNVGEQ